MVSEWPLVGRASDLQVLLEALRRPASGGCVVAGPPGVGKTRLAREAAAALGQDTSVEWTAATAASASIPFGALAHLLPGPASDAAEDRARLLRGAREAVVDRAGGRTLVLAVDDAHLLDAGAAALVHQLVTTGMGRVLLTVRTGEVPVDAIQTLWKDGLVQRMDVGPLARQDVDVLVEQVLGGPVEQTTLQRFWQLSGGNALYLRELLLGVVGSGAIVELGAVRRWAGAFRPSDRLSTIIDDRVRTAGPGARDVLDHLALGEPLPLDVLLELCDHDAVAEVERSGLVVVDGAPPAARLCHPLYAEALRAAAGVVTRRRVAGRLAAAMGAGASTSSATLLRVARWQVESAGPVDPDLLTRAASMANLLLEHEEAERLARRATERGGGFRAGLELGWALNHQGRSAEAEIVLRPLSSEAVSDQDRVDLVVARYFGRSSATGFRPELEPLLLDAEAAVQTPHLQAFLRAQRATLLVFSGRVDEGVALATMAVDGDDEPSALRAVPALGGAWLCDGRATSAAALAERMLEPALRLREELPQAPAWVVSVLLPALVTSGRLDDAEGVLRVSEASIERGITSGETVSFVAFGKGMVALHRGCVRTARRWLQESVPALREVSRWRTPLLLAQLAEACALSGDSAGAAAATAEAEELVAGAQVYEGLVRRARAWAAVARGRRSAAVELSLEAAAWSEDHGQRTAAMHALHDAVRLGAGARAAERLAALAPGVEGRWAACFLLQARGVLAGDGDLLEMAATDLEASGAMLLAAEAAAQAGGAFAGKGLRTSAARAAARAHRLAEGCEGARSPALQELDQPPGLTRREREIAALAAEGLSSPEIAERLVVSVRTVEGHLHRIYVKLGVHDRAALARDATDTDTDPV